MFRAFVDGATPNSPTPAVAETRSSKNNTPVVIGVVLAIVIVAVIAYLAL